MSYLYLTDEYFYIYRLIQDLNRNDGLIANNYSKACTYIRTIGSREYDIELYREREQFTLIFSQSGTYILESISDIDDIFKILLSKCVNTKKYIREYEKKFTMTEIKRKTKLSVNNRIIICSL